MKQWPIAALVWISLVAPAAAAEFDDAIAARATASQPYLATDYLPFIRSGTTYKIIGSLLVTTTDAQTLTNKTINGAANTLTVRLGSDVSGTLPVANGGTGSGAGGTALTNLSSGQIYTLGGTPRISGSSTYDLAIATNPTRYNLWDLTLTPSADTTNIWEGLGIFYTLNGPGHANGEINHFHANFTVASGALSAQSEAYEAKLENAGTVTAWNGFLAIPQNGAAGTATTLYGVKTQLTNSNASAGSVNTFSALNMEAMAGGGSLPSNYTYLRGADASAYSGILGHVNIGTLSDKGFPLYVQGSGATSATFSLVIKDSGGSTNEFFCQDNGVCTSVGGFNLQGGLQINGKQVASGTAPTISSGFGSSPSIVAHNGTMAFEVNVGGGGSATNGVIGLPTATTGWNCQATDITTNSATVFITKQTASSTTSATLGNFNTSAVAAAWVANDKLRVSCFAY